MFLDHLGQFFFPSAGVTVLRRLFLRVRFDLQPSHKDLALSEVFMK